jgi:heterodisulfide reductase subunit C
VGCGRCAEICHGDVGMPSVVELLRRGPLGQGTPATGGRT